MVRGKDYYKVLGVERSATEVEIKKAFRSRARELHPDVNAHDPEAEEKFKEAAEAYEVLSDSSSRQTYDMFGHDGLRRGGWTPSSSGLSGIADIFEALFGLRGHFGFGGSDPMGGADEEVSIEVTLNEVATGASREVTFDALIPCERCQASGAEPDTEINTCSTCHGSGRIRKMASTPFGNLASENICDICNGRGQVPEVPCQDCEGKGRIEDVRSLDLDIPAGIEDGQQIRVSGGGHAGLNGSSPGDLYIEVNVQEDERFERDGKDLITVLDLSAPAAMLGKQTEIETLDGPREIDIQAGSQHGDQIILGGQGLPSINSLKRGDQRVILNVIVPTNLTDEQRELAEELNETLEPENLRPSEGFFSRIRRTFK